MESVFIVVSESENYDGSVEKSMLSSYKSREKAEEESERVQRSVGDDVSVYVEEVTFYE